MQGDMMPSAPAANTRVVEWNMSRQVCLTETWRWCRWHVVDVCMTDIDACMMPVMLSSMRTTTSQSFKALPAAHAPRSGARYWQHERGGMMCILHVEW